MPQLLSASLSCGLYRPSKLCSLALAALLLAPAWAAAQTPQTGLEMALALQQALTESIAQAEKSVVAIAKAQAEGAGEFRIPRHFDPFRSGGIQLPDDDPRSPDFVPTQFGTGVIVGSDGLILTCYHVLEPNEHSTYWVTTAQRERYRATIRAADPRSDLAVLKIEAEGLPVIRMGNAEDLRKGLIVLALGNPYAIARDGQASASWGIISNISRKAPPVPGPLESDRMPTLHHYGTLIHTDAKLNLGTSGGPLLNLQGEMIGLTTSQAAIVGYEKSAGYAFPVDDTFRRVLKSLKEGREVEYGFLGIAPSDLDPRQRQEGLHGSLVTRVYRGTPAWKKLQPGDLITHVDGKQIFDRTGLMLGVGRQDVGSQVELTVERNGHSLPVVVELTKYPVRGKQIHQVPTPSWRGLTVDYPTAAADLLLRAGYRADFPEQGSVVAIDVEQDSPAWRAGLRPGSLISHVGRRIISNPQRFHAAVEGKSGPVSVRLLSGLGEEETVTVQPE